MSDEIIEDTLDEAPVVGSSDEAMEDTIRKTLDEINARGKTEEETEEQKADRLRDDKGRFAAKTAAPEQTPPQPDESPQVEAQPDPVAAPVTVPPEMQRLGLRKDEAEAFAKADKAIQDAFIRRSEEMHRGFEQVKSKAQFGDQMERAIAPFMQTIQQLGITPDVAVQKLMSADNALRNGSEQQKTQMLLTIARDYGVNLQQATEYQASLPQEDPRIRALEERLQRQDAWIQQQSQAREWQEREALNSDIAKFQSDPKHIHFDAVRNDMAGLLQAGLATTLEDAYEKAIFANPTIRAQVLAKQQAEADEKRKQEAIQKAQAARKAAATNLPRKGLQPVARPVGSIDDTIRQEAERLGLL